MRSVNSCVADRDLLGVGQRVQQQPGAHRLLGLGPGLGVELLAGLALPGQELGEPLLVVVEGVHRVVLAGIDLGLDHALRQRHLGGLDQRLEHLVPGLVGLVHPLTWPSRWRRSAVSSSTVSNSLASWANSSSTSGSSRSLTAVTVTVTSASRPAKSPATSLVVKVADSPADSPVIASSMPSTRSPWPDRW